MANGTGQCESASDLDAWLVAQSAPEVDGEGVCLESLDGSMALAAAWWVGSWSCHRSGSGIRDAGWFSRLLRFFLTHYSLRVHGACVRSRREEKASGVPATTCLGSLSRFARKFYLCLWDLGSEDRIRSLLRGCLVHLVDFFGR